MIRKTLLTNSLLNKRKTEQTNYTQARMFKTKQVFRVWFVNVISQKKCWNAWSEIPSAVDWKRLNWRWYLVFSCLQTGPTFWRRYNLLLPRQRLSFEHQIDRKHPIACRVGVIVYFFRRAKRHYSLYRTNTIDVTLTRAAVNTIFSTFGMTWHELGLPDVKPSVLPFAP